MDSPPKIEDSQKLSKDDRNEHEWEGFRQETIIRLRQLDISIRFHTPNI